MTTTFNESTVAIIPNNPATTDRCGVNDLFIGADGNISIVSAIQAVLLACKAQAETILGEMVLNTENGLPYFELIWNGSPNFQQWEVYLQAAFEVVDGVQQVSSIELSTRLDDDKRSRIFSYRAVIVTIYGEGEINGIV